jgi:hypothetical protein
MHGGFGLAAAAGGVEEKGDVIGLRASGFVQRRDGGEGVVEKLAAGRFVPDGEDARRLYRLLESGERFGESPFVDDGEAGAAVGGVVGVIGGAGEGVDRYGDAAHLHRAEEAGKKLRGVGEDEQHAVAGLNAELQPGGGDAGGAVGELLVRQRRTNTGNRNSAAAAFAQVAIEEIVGGVQKTFTTEDTEVTKRNSTISGRALALHALSELLAELGRRARVEGDQIPERLAVTAEGTQGDGGRVGMSSDVLANRMIRMASKPGENLGRSVGVVAQGAGEVVVVVRELFGEAGDGLGGRARVAGQLGLAVPVGIDAVELGGSEANQLAQERKLELAAVGGQAGGFEQAQSVEQSCGARRR